MSDAVKEEVLMQSSDTKKGLPDKPLEPLRENPTGVVNEVALAQLQDGISDHWLEGKIDAAILFNRHLGKFSLTTTVKDRVASIEGMVDTEADRDLVSAILRSVDGLQSYENNLVVEPRSPRLASLDEKDTARRNIGEIIEDYTTTAIVRNRLLLNQGIDASKIAVETFSATVKLTGSASNREEAVLIVEQVKLIPGVVGVESELTIEET